MRKVAHIQRAVKIIDFVQDADHDMIVMEYVQGTDLFDLVERTNGKGLERRQVKDIFQQLCQALQECFDAGVAHRDVKLENILIDNAGNLKLCDFGMAMIFEDDNDWVEDDYCGSSGYAAPEVLQCKPYRAMLSDAWSAGVVLYVMATGFQPFEVDDSQVCCSLEDHERAVRLRTLEGVYPESPNLDPQINAILKQLLCPVSRRKSLRDIIKIQESSVINTL